MDRRRYLSLLGLSVGLAGCAGGGTGTVGNQATSEASPTSAAATSASSTAGKTTTGGETSTQSDTATATDSPTESATPTEAETTEVTTTAGTSAAVAIVSEELKVQEGDYSTEAWVVAEVENQSGKRTGQIHLQAQFYNSAGDLIENGDAYMDTLDAGETWYATVPLLAGDPNEVEDFELSGEVANSVPNYNPEGLEVLESELQKGDYDTIVTGRVKNNRSSAVEYVQATVKFYADENTVLSSDWTNVSDLKAGGTWKFEVSFLGFGEAPGMLSDHKVLLTESAF